MVGNEKQKYKRMNADGNSPHDLTALATPPFHDPTYVVSSRQRCANLYNHLNVFVSLCVCVCPRQFFKPRLAAF